jgi:hypothetical protein
MKQNERLLILCIGFFLGMLLALPLYAQALISWQKDEVVPVVIVKPDIGGFVPTDGATIGNSWRKDEVKPVCLLRPVIGGFAPRQGSAIGNTWRKDEVKAMILVVPQMGRFVPAGPAQDF